MERQTDESGATINPGVLPVIKEENKNIISKKALSIDCDLIRREVMIPAREDSLLLKKNE